MLEEGRHTGSTLLMTPCSKYVSPLIVLVPQKKTLEEENTCAFHRIPQAIMEKPCLKWEDLGGGVL